MRIVAAIEYDGQPYCGWQHQEHSPSVQAEVDKAFSRVANHPLRVVCAGRTDTGVHATGQIVHFDTPAERSDWSWLRGANSCLPSAITVLWVMRVPEAFHARFSAVRRAYRYVISNRSERPAILHGRVTWQFKPLDVGRMQQAAMHLIGKHDFSSYRAAGCQARSPVREIYRLEVSRRGEMIFLDIEANAFLHHMVRNIAGVLMTIGAGEAAVDWSREVLAHQDRKLGGITASPAGLYLTQVHYPAEFAIPVSSLAPFE
ncbi:MAG: tRNA pseudouridine(38-40) synthase TruA [Gammaproteobacteria bacterium]